MAMVTVVCPVPTIPIGRAAVIIRIRSGIRIVVNVRAPIVPVGIIIQVRRISGVAAGESKTKSPGSGNQDGGLSAGALCGNNYQSTYRHCN
jgi:hypothetical protein